jgi:hypothetical protein
MVEKLNFPVLLYKAKSVDYFICKDANMLTLCTVAALKNKYYNNLLLIDTQGKEYLIISAVKIKNETKPRLSFSYIFGSRFIRIQPVFDLDYGQQRNIEFVKKIILDEFETNIDFWQENEDYDLLLCRIKIADSIEKLMKLLLNL